MYETLIFYIDIDTLIVITKHVIVDRLKVYFFETQFNFFSIRLEF